MGYDASQIQCLANGTTNGTFGTLTQACTGAVVAASAAGTYTITLDAGLPGEGRGVALFNRAGTDLACAHGDAGLRRAHRLGDLLEVEAVGPEARRLPACLCRVVSCRGGALSAQHVPVPAIYSAE